MAWFVVSASAGDASANNKLNAPAEAGTTNAEAGTTNAEAGTTNAEAGATNEAPNEAANLVRILHSDCDALQARVDLVQQAKEEIDAAYYIVGDDEVPLVFLGLLRDAARRGVVVRLLVDGHDGNNQMPRALQAYLIREGVEIKEYQPPLVVRPYWIKNRMHDKLLIVDGVHLVAGGRNMRDEYFGQDCRNFVDRDVYIRGCVAADARCYFLARWSSDYVRDTRLDARVKRDILKYQTHTELNDACDEESIAAAGCLIDETMDDARKCGLVKFDTGADCGGLSQFSRRDENDSADESDCRENGTVPFAVDCIRFLHDDPSCKKKKCPGIADDVLELLSGARCGIVLETPYLVLSRKMKRILASAARRGVSVKILTNSLATNNHHSAQAAYENDKRWLLRHGIELWELAGCDHLHAKAAVIDGCTAIIGSYNFDMLSEKRNSETAVAIFDRRVAAELTASIDAHLESANRIGADLRPVGFAEKYPGADPKIVKETRRKRLIAPFVRGSL